MPKSGHAHLGADSLAETWPRDYEETRSGVPRGARDQIVASKIAWVPKLVMGKVLVPKCCSRSNIAVVVRLITLRLLSALCTIVPLKYQSPEQSVNESVALESAPCPVNRGECTCKSQYSHTLNGTTSDCPASAEVPGRAGYPHRRVHHFSWPSELVQQRRQPALFYEGRHELESRQAGVYSSREP